MNIFLLIFYISLTLAMLGNASGSPTDDTNATPFHFKRKDLDDSIPNKKSDDSCKKDGKPDGEPIIGCRTNKEALTPINDAMTKYKITTRGEAVGLLALMIFESAEFNKSINDNLSGQGTYNMQSFRYNYQYGKEVNRKEFDKIYKVFPIDNPEEIQKQYYKDPTQIPQDKKNGMVWYLAVVLNDADCFGSAMWYLSTIASDQRDSLVKGTSEAYQDYITKGVNAPWDKRRGDIWNRVDKAVDKQTPVVE